MQAGDVPVPAPPSSCSLIPSPPGISEDSKVEAPAFTDAVRMYRQSKEQYGTWDMLCGNQSQVRADPGAVWGPCRAGQGPPLPHPFTGPEQPGDGGAAAGAAERHRPTAEGQNTGAPADLDPGAGG